MGEATEKRTIALPPDEAARERQAQPWRVVTLCGSVALGAAFILPSLPARGGRLSPLIVFWSTLTSRPTNLRAFLDLLLPDGATYLFGLTALAEVIVRLAGARVRLLGTALLIMGTGAAFLADITWRCLRGEWVTHNEILGTLALAGLVFYYTGRAIRLHGHRAHLSTTFVGAFASAVWFGSWIHHLIVRIPPLPSNFILPAVILFLLPLLGSLMILLGTIGEAHVLTRRTWTGTIWRLITCRLRDLPISSDTCPGCGYRLFGLRDTRCPECGREFTFEELGVTPEQIGFAGDAPPSDI